MCSPHLSFMINALGKIFHKNGMQSHSELAKHFEIEEDKMVKVDYDWVNRTIDIIGDNKQQNTTATFQLKDSHYRAIDAFIKRIVGTKAKLIEWLKLNCNDIKICDEAKLLLTEAGFGYYEGIKNKKKKFDLSALIKAFNMFPNLNWDNKITT